MVRVSFRMAGDTTSTQPLITVSPAMRNSQAAPAAIASSAASAFSLVARVSEKVPTLASSARVTVTSVQPV